MALSNQQKNKMQKIGIIAGNGILPGLLKKKLSQKKIPHTVIGIEGFADPKITDKTIATGQIGTALKYFKKEKVTDVILIGGVKRQSLSELKLDFTGWWFILKNAHKMKGDNAALTLLREEIEKHGFNVKGIDDMMPELLAEKKVYTTRKACATNLRTIKYGFKLAKQLGSADIGQSIVVQEGLCLGVEAIEGTDALIKRCGELKRKGRGPILVKVKKDNQDRRLDLPTIGVDTVINAKEAGFSGIAVEAGNVMLSDAKKIIEKANELKIFVMGI